GLLGAQPSDVAGKTQVAAAITDCDGDNVMHATVDVAGAPSCGQAGHGFPCTAYFRNGVPNKSSADSDADGQFVVLGAPAGALTINVNGVVDSNGGAAQAIGDFTIFGVADTVAIGTTSPLKN